MNPHPYIYNGQQTFKQPHLQCDIQLLDRVRIAADLGNEMIDYDVVMLSQANIVNDSNGDDVELFEGLKVYLYTDDSDENNNPDALLAEGEVIANNSEQYKHVIWFCKLNRHPILNRYIYNLSDLKQAAENEKNHKVVSK